MFNEALHNLHIALHPHTQHRATYSSGKGPLVEPTLALDTPIKGGNLNLGEMVKEMARQTNAGVVVLDAVLVAAGECGHFGEGTLCAQCIVPGRIAHTYAYGSATSVLQLSNNLLHFLSSPSRHSTRLLEPAMWTMPMSKLKTFFNNVINVSAPPPAEVDESSTTPLRRLQIIYVKDDPTLVAFSSVWYSAFLASVQQRQQEPLLRLSSLVLKPTIFVFGISPIICSS